MANTPVRAIRIDDALWLSLDIVAQLEMKSKSDVIRDALERYLKEKEERNG